MGEKEPRLEEAKMDDILEVLSVHVWKNKEDIDGELRNKGKVTPRATFFVIIEHMESRGLIISQPGELTQKQIKLIQWGKENKQDTGLTPPREYKLTAEGLKKRSEIPDAEPSLGLPETT